jgi:hypothetical protein
MKDLATELVELVPHLRQMHQYYSASVCYHAAEFIRNNLTDVKPVVHGKWIPRDLTWGRRYYYCSNCEETVDMPTAMGVPMFCYCPNCGARMDGDEDD